MNASPVSCSGINAKVQVASKDMEEIQLALSRLATCLYQVAGDITALGSFGCETIAFNTGLRVKEQVATILSAAEELDSQLTGLRKPFIQRQLAEFHITHESSHLKLHIGTGKYQIESWLNIDIYPGRIPDQSFPAGQKYSQFPLNTKWGLPFPDGSVSRVFMSHILEHLYYPNEALEFVKEIHRVLEPGGVVRIIVPDVEKCITAYVANDHDFYAGREATWTWWTKRRTRLEDFLDYVGVGVEPTALLSSHKYGYDFETLQGLLQQAEFGRIQRSEYMQSEHRDLQIDDHGGVAKATYRGHHYSLFVEATR